MVLKQVFSLVIKLSLDAKKKKSKYRNRRARLEDLAVTEGGNNVGLNYSRGNRVARKMS